MASNRYWNLGAWIFAVAGIGLVPLWLSQMAVIETDPPDSDRVTGVFDCSASTVITGDVLIDDMNALSILDGVVAIDGDITVTNVSSLTTPFPIGLDLVTGNLYVRGTGLADLSGLETLTRVEGDVNIRGNRTLTSLSGLNGLTCIAGRLDIQFNDSLTTLSGLENLTRVDEHLTIRNNHALPQREVDEWMSTVEQEAVFSVNTLESLDAENANSE
jgi:hypothetical protein